MAAKRLRSSQKLVETTSPFNASVTLVTVKKEEEEEEVEGASVLEVRRPGKRVRLTGETVVEKKKRARRESTEEDGECAEVDEERTAESGYKKVKVKRDASAPKRTTTKKKKTAVKAALSVAHPEPENWRRVYALIRQHRGEEVAPVDTMGCDSAGRFEGDARSQRLSILFSLILSAQTKDEYTDAAMKNLRAAVGGCITVDALLSTSSKDIQNAVRPAGMAEKKTKYLLETAKLLREHFDSDVPRTVEGLMSLSGVGPKITFLALQVAWNQNDGIGVDVHVHRLSNVLGWNNPEAPDEERTRVNLESWLPKEYWKEVNHLLVGFGQTICSKKTPKCGQCRVNAAGLCPSAREESRLNREEFAAVEIKLEDSEALYKIEPN